MRKTKIIATLGPASDQPKQIGELIDAGMNIARLNMSHAPHDWVRDVVKVVRDEAEKRGKLVGILLDTQGPEIRTGNLPSDLHLEIGKRFTFTVRGEQSEELHSVDVNYENFIDDISVGDVIMVDSGEIHMKVLEKHANKVDCEILTPGKLGSRRHINLPGVKVSLPPITDKDREDIALGMELKVDFIALSFVREANDIILLRELIALHEHQPAIIAKIEDQQAVENFESIIATSDGIMVARGDLGIECPYEELPIIQRRLVKACLRIGRPVIVATHMLESMIGSPMPTRAEITDVANAVFEEADAIMLSGESAMGQYPVKCVEVLDRIACRTERSGGANFHELAEITSSRAKLASSAVMLADQLKADAILLFTDTGKMARYVSWQRPRHSPIYAVCSDDDIAASLTLNRGVTSFQMNFDEGHPDTTIDRALARLVKQRKLKEGDSVIIITGIRKGGQVVGAILSRVV
ncbi:MAG: pyruvate kinase [Verrucomicrobiales bacterium]|nr:pyruvate kinase [Verrucomicrobiales bacterium]